MVPLPPDVSAAISAATSVLSDPAVDSVVIDRGAFDPTVDPVYRFAAYYRGPTGATRLHGYYASDPVAAAEVAARNDPAPPFVRVSSTSSDGRPAIDSDGRPNAVGAYYRPAGLVFPDPNVDRFAVSAFSGWSDHVGRRTTFFSLGDALDFASSLDDPLVDVIDLDAGGVVAVRRAVPFPGATPNPDFPFVPRDDFPKGV